LFVAGKTTIRDILWIPESKIIISSI